jgi:hypothetical protein
MVPDTVLAELSHPDPDDPAAVARPIDRLDSGGLDASDSGIGSGAR